MALDPNVLLEESKCISCNSNASLAEALILALLQRIAENGGGGGGSANMSGAGSPVGVVTPTAINIWYYDTSGIAWWWSTGLTSADWINAI